MKNGIYVLAAVAGAWMIAMACPATVRDQIANATQLPDQVQIEADRQLEMFVSWVRDDGARPVQDFQDRDLN